MPENVDLGAAIGAIVADVRRSGATAAQRLDRVAALLETVLDVDDEDPTQFRRLDHEVTVGLMLNLEREAVSLTSLGALDLAAAPDLVSVHSMGLGTGMLVKRYRYAAGEHLVRLEDSWEMISDRARRRFLHDMRLLADYGRIHPFASRGLHHLWMGRDTGVIVLDAWDAMRDCPGPACVEHLQKVARNLDSRR